MSQNVQIENSLDPPFQLSRQSVTYLAIALSKAPNAIVFGKKEVEKDTLEDQINTLEARLTKRDISNRTRDFYELQLHKARECVIEDDANAIRDLEVMRAYAAGQEEKRLAQKVELNQWEVYSRFADYAMVNCQRLQKVNGNYEFQNYQWKEIVRRLDMEDVEHEAWQSQNTVSTSAPEPMRPIRSSLLQAMEKLNENDCEQMFWEIRLYAARNAKMHSGILDLRGQAKYDEVLEVIRNDIQTIADLLPEEKKKDDIQRYRETVFRYRRKYWDEREGEGQMMEVPKKPTTLEHEKQMAENAMGEIKKKASNPKQSAMEAIKATLKAVAKQMEVQGPLIQVPIRKSKPLER